MNNTCFCSWSIDLEVCVHRSGQWWSGMSPPSCLWQIECSSFVCDARLPCIIAFELLNCSQTGVLVLYFSLMLATNLFIQKGPYTRPLGSWTNEVLTRSQEQFSFLPWSSMSISFQIKTCIMQKENGRKSWPLLDGKKTDTAIPSLCSTSLR